MDPEMGPDFRSSLEALASQTNTVSPTMNATRERAGRNRKCSPSVASSGVGKDPTSVGSGIRVNGTSHVVTNRRSLPFVQIWIMVCPSGA